MEDTRRTWREASAPLAELRHVVDTPSRARVKRRIAELQRSLKLAEARVERYKSALEALSLSLKLETPSPWADFRIRLHLGKLWLRDLEHKHDLALAARAAVSVHGSGQDRALLFDAPSAGEKQHLQRALKAGTLLCARAPDHAACQSLLLAYLNSSPRLLRLRS